MPENILIVDDEHAIAQLSDMWLKWAGYSTTLAYDGGSAIAAATNSHPDLILLDIRMPDMDGFDVHRYLKAQANFADTPVIFLSAHAQESARQEATASGAACFLPKPCERKLLLDAVRTALASRHSQPAIAQGAEVSELAPN